ncbi:MFS transporter [Chloroflexota bacterium]
MNHQLHESPSAEGISKRIWGFVPNVFFLGLVSLLTDVSSEMIFTLVPLFLCNVLGAAATVVGLVGGLSESVDAIFRIFSGRLSDKLKKRKSLAVIGYSLSTIVKPFMYLASNWGVVLAVRFGDRAGKGIRTSPRDALIAGSVSAGERGKSFGLHRTMDTSGAVIGLAVAALIIYLVQKKSLELSLSTYQWLILVGVVPAILAIIVLVIFVKEKHEKANTVAYGQSPAASDISAKLDTRFKIFLAIMAVFTLGNSSDFFVILRAQDLGSPVLYITLMLVLFNITYTVFSLPAGILSDRLGRKRVILLGWLVYALVYLGFAVATSTWQIWLLFACYGIYYGIVEGVVRAFVADMVPEEKRGTAYGLYYGVVGLTLLPASLIAGWLWDMVSPAAPFYLGAGLAFMAMLGLMALIRE